jgi:ribonuclease H / adenosylcobalamin/alpha-ribazole phosphatase
VATTLLLIRHGSCDGLDVRLAGRAPGLPLDAGGRDQLARLAERLADLPIAAVYSSPVQRARESAALVAAPHAQPVRRLDALQEVDFGAWTGRRFDELARDDGWRRFHALRAIVRPPGGETLLEVQARVAAGLQRIAAAGHAGPVALVSHGDVIRSTLALLAGVPLDLALRFRVDLASVTAIRIHADAVEVLAVNACAGGIPPELQ